ncbi:Protein GDAP2 -like protein [Babesia sp. Xinjiang]|uniref:Protein GDAP2 -like protein n=1 Tax=Babesia sp. Xinjiang TaxID=462227 RepID=UPI000A24C24A|nr:Protein GDAP2 -like protein [Babesia sp. Xinjiang]ORM40457.1 Protein GDAP2 -like protein [Babesia sp. Xinjiang]
MTEQTVADLAETVCWVVGEIGQLIDSDWDEYVPRESIRPIKKVPQDKMEPWTGYEKWRRAEVTRPDVHPKFYINKELNSKLYIGSCDILELEVGAIAVFLDELSPHASRMARRIQIQSGKPMPHDEFNRLRCGDVMLQRSYNIGSEHVAYAIAPRYSTKYPDASANIVNMCVREVLKASIDAGVDTVAFSLMMGREFTYPDEEFATAVLRSVRRWLELPVVADKIRRVFIFGIDAEVYSVMRRFFPRDKVEEHLSGELLEAGNEYGEIVKEERSIRISEGFAGETATADDGDSGNERTQMSAVLANFGDNCRVGSDRNISAKDYDFDYYYRLSLSLMQLPVYREMDDSGFAMLLGRDIAQRPVIAIDASKIPSGLSNTHMVAYVLRIMQPIIQNKFVVLLRNMGKPKSRQQLHLTDEQTTPSWHLRMSVQLPLIYFKYLGTEDYAILVLSMYTVLDGQLGVFCML